MAIYRSSLALLLFGIALPAFAEEPSSLSNMLCHHARETAIQPSTGERRSGHRPIESRGGPSNNRHDRQGVRRNSLYLHGANGRERAISSGTVGSAWSRPRMVRRQHCRIVYRATRSRCESRDDAVFLAVPTPAPSPSWVKSRERLVTGAQFEIRIDGTPRTYRDRKDYAIEAARFLKSKNPHSMVEIKDLQSGDVTAVALRPG